MWSYHINKLSSYLMRFVTMGSIYRMCVHCMRMARVYPTGSTNLLEKVLCMSAFIVIGAKTPFEW